MKTHTKEVTLYPPHALYTNNNDHDFMKKLISRISAAYALFIEQVYKISCFPNKNFLFIKKV